MTNKMLDSFPWTRKQDNMGNNRDNIALTQLNLSTDAESRAGSDISLNFKTHKIQDLNFYKSRHKLFLKFIVGLFIVNIVLAIVLVVDLTRNRITTTFFGDYLTAGNKFNPQSSTILKYKAAITSESKIELLNKDKLVVPVHSHNDYWRKTPLFEALRFGINSVEADVWFLPNSKDSQLFVGHKKISLSRFKTLNALYLSNLEALLDDANSNISFDNTYDTLHGVFYDDPYKTLNLVIDIKTQANHTFIKIMDDLSPFITKNYLTYYNSTSKELKDGPLSITISGNIPFEMIKSQDIRYAFIDAPLNDSNFKNNYDQTNSLYASSSLERLTGSKKALGTNGQLSDDQKNILNNTISMAHSLGIKTRIWDTPRWPESTRNTVWKDLLELNVDLINADDLKGALTF